MQVTPGQRITYCLVSLCLVAILFLSSGMWFYPNNLEEDGLMNVTPGGRLLYNGLAALMLSLVLLLYRQVWAFWIEYRLLFVLLVAYCAAGFLSYDAVASFKFTLRIFLLCSCFVLLARLYSPSGLISILYFFFSITIIINLFYINFFPQYGIMGGMHSGSWRGMFTHKNQFGYYCAYAAVVCHAYGWYRKDPKALMPLGVSLLMMIKSNSSGSYSAVLVALLIGLAVSRSPRVGIGIKILPLMIIALFGILLIPFGGIAFEYVLGLLGKDPTLTSRTDIWAFYLQEWLHNPILGTGPDAYMRDPGLADRFAAFRGLGDLKSPHNGYIAMLLQVGGIGTLAYVSLLLVSIKRGVVASILSQHPAYKTMLLLIVLQVMRGTIETNGSVVLNCFFGLTITAYALLKPPKNLTYN